MRVPLPSRLRRRWLSAWLSLFVRALAMGGLLLAAVLAAASHRGLICLAFLTAASLVAIAVGRAHRRVRTLAVGLLLHCTIRDALIPLERRGWSLKHGVRWPEVPGDGHLAMTPAGDLAFAIKDCPSSISDFDLAQTQDFATALSETGRPYVPICVAAAAALSPGSHRRSFTGDRQPVPGGGRAFTDRGVLCCPPEQLVPELLDAEGAFLASLADEAVHSQLLYSEASAA